MSGVVREISSTTWECSVLGALGASGLRLTVPRHTIVRWIAAHHRPFCAEVLAEELAHPPQQVGRATAYRTIEWLRDHGWLVRAHTLTSEATYVRALPGYHHARCNACGMTLLIDGCAVLDALRDGLAQHGFQVQSELLELLGTCAGCRYQERRP